MSIDLRGRRVLFALAASCCLVALSALWIGASASGQDLREDAKPRHYRDIGIAKLMKGAFRNSGTEEIGGQLFRYTWASKSGRSTLINLSESSCRSITLTAGFNGKGASDETTEVFQIFREGGPAVEKTFHKDQLDSLTANKLRGGALKVQFDTHNGQNLQGPSTWGTGTANCYTRDGHVGN